MIRKMPVLMGCAVAGIVIGSIVIAIAFAQETKTAGPKAVTLLKPVTEGGKPLMEALKSRQSARAFSPKKLPDQVLSNLLWAACGVNRPDGKRTAPSALNWQEVDVYVATAEGLWLFDPKEHTLKPVVAQDVRASTGSQDFVKDAPLNLVYVADFTRMSRVPEAEKKWMAAADTGFISQNVYLFCASEGLATVVRGMIDKPALAKAMNLRPEQQIILAQTVGYPK